MYQALDNAKKKAYHSIGMKVMRVSAILILLFALVGCANGDIVTPEVIYNPIPKFKQNAAHSDPHMLWGEYTFFFNESHNAIDVVPNRLLKKPQINRLFAFNLWSCMGKYRVS
jgi:hypothetical protein